MCLCERKTVDSVELTGREKTAKQPYEKKTQGRRREEKKEMTNVTVARLTRAYEKFW